MRSTARRTKPFSEASEGLDIARSQGANAAKARRVRDPLADDYQDHTPEALVWLQAYDQEDEKFEAAQDRAEDLSPRQRAQRAGERAARRNVDRDENPHRKGSEEYIAWHQGYDGWEAPLTHVGRPDPEVTEFRQQFEPAAGEQLVTIHVDLIDDDFNPRQHFAKDVQELAESIKQYGLLQPVPIYPKPDGRYGLVAGGRRLRATKLAGKGEISCILRPAPPALRISRLIENDHRKDLDAFERAEEYAHQCKPIAEGGEGLTQQKLAQKLGITQGQVANTIRLLEVPEAFRAYLLDGRTSVTALRDGLLKYSQLGPELLAKAEPFLKRSHAPYDANAISYAVYEACSKSLREFGWNCPLQLSSLSKEQKQQLGVVKVRHTEFATNAQLFDELKEKAQEKQARRLESSGKQSRSSPTKADKAAAAKKQAEILNKRLYRYVTGWRQQRLLEKLPEASIDHVWRILLHFACAREAGQREHELADVLKSHGARVPTKRYGYTSVDDLIGALYVLKAAPADLARQAVLKWVAGPFDGYHADFGPGDIETVAAAFGVDLRRDWRCERAFLELLTADQLRGLAEEWKLGEPEASKRGELIDWLEKKAAGKAKLPKALADVKPVQLI